MLFCEKEVISVRKTLSTEKKMLLHNMDVGSGIVLKKLKHSQVFVLTVFRVLRDPGMTDQIDVLYSTTVVHI